MVFFVKLRTSQLFVSTLFELIFVSKPHA